MNPHSVASCRMTWHRLMTWAVVAVVIAACGERVGPTGAASDGGSSTPTALQSAASFVETTEARSTIATPPVTDVATTMPPGDAPPTTQPAVLDTELRPIASLPPPVPATEHQLAVLVTAFSMPGRPDLHDVPFGQEVTVGNRGLVVNVPIFGAWQYSDLDAQDMPGASIEASEAATRDLLAQLGIDAAGLTATFTPNGAGTDVGLAGCIVRFAEDGRIEFAAGLVEDIA